MYPKINIQRALVPDNFVKWSVEFTEYNPIFYESERLAHAPWADRRFDDVNSPTPKWHSIDNQIDRTSYHGSYAIRNGMPLNVGGRTGIIGRGLLGRYGPNHAGDPIVTKWKRNADGSIVQHAASTKNVLQMLAIQRRDSGEWAIPGGMVDSGETVSNTLKREFIEEALNGQMDVEVQIDAFFSAHGREIYTGYVDDPRNTDNAWMETTAYNFHDATGELLGGLKFEAGDDAKNVRWMDIDQYMQLYASHREMIASVASFHMAHW